MVLFSGVASKPLELLDLGKNFGYLRFELAEVFSGDVILGPNREVLSSFCCFFSRVGESAVLSFFCVFSEFFDNNELVSALGGDSEMTLVLSKAFEFDFSADSKSLIMPLLFALLLLFI